MKKRRLTQKQERFVHAYFTSLNATRAAIEAGYSENRASEIGYQLLQKTTVQEHLAKLQAKAREKSDITKEEVLGVLASILRSDVPDYFENGKLKEFDKLTPAQKKALESVKVGKSGVEFKLPSKIQAVATVNKMLGYDSATDFNVQLQNMDEAALDAIITRLITKNQ